MTDGANRSVQVDVQYAAERDDAPAESDIAGWIRSAVCELDMEGSVEISVRIVDEAEGRELNRNYRNKDYATNVLSFPVDESVLPDGIPRALGDIVICSPVVRRESEVQGKALADHWAHMLVHGTLHLLGFDHEADNDADEMEAIEKRILAAGGVGDPYAA